MGLNSQLEVLAGRFTAAMATSSTNNAGWGLDWGRKARWMIAKWVSGRWLAALKALVTQQNSRSGMGVAGGALKTAEKAASNNSNTGSACLLASEIAQADAPSELAVLLRTCCGVMQLAQAHRPSSRSSSKCSS
jgi:hypothetical protein